LNRGRRGERPHRATRSDQAAALTAQAPAEMPLEGADRRAGKVTPLPGARPVLPLSP
jgi:hypothetical protein